MNLTGIIRKIDDLGRIVLPKELRKYLNINPGDDFQILLDDDKIILEKYSYLKNKENETIKIIEIFKEETGYNIYLVNNNVLINNNEQVTNEIINIIQERKIFIKDSISNNKISNSLNNEGRLIIYPIVIDSDLLGAIILISNDEIKNMIKTAKIIYKIIKNYYI